MSALCVAIGGFFAMLMASAVEAAGPDISTQRLLSSWQDGEAPMTLLAEMIAAAFASGFTWGQDAAGKHVFCAPHDLKARGIMSALEAFLRDHPQMAAEPYGAAMAGTLSQAFPCSGQ